MISWKLSVPYRQSAPADNTAEKLTGTFYSVKVGVFSSPENARRHAETFKQHNQPVDIVSKDISGKKLSCRICGPVSGLRGCGTVQAEVGGGQQ